MKVSTAFLLTALLSLLGCERQSLDYEFEKPQASTSDAIDKSSTEQKVQEEVEEKVEEEVVEEVVEQVEETPQEVVVTPLTNADLLAMDTVVVTAIIAANNSVQYFSDVGSTKATTAADVTNAAVAPAGTAMAAGAALQVKAGQKLVFCNHASSDAAARPLRVHAANGSAFAHWQNNQTLAPGACSFNLGFPEDINANAVGNNPGNNLYNHNGNENASRIFIDVQAP